MPPKGSMSRQGSKPKKINKLRKDNNPRKSTNPHFSDAPPRDLAFPPEEELPVDEAILAIPITLCEFLSFLVNWYRTYDGAFRFASNAITTEIAVAIINYFRDPGDKGEICNNALCHIVTNAFEAGGVHKYTTVKDGVTKILPWSLGRHQEENTKDYYGPWDHENLTLTGFRHDGESSFENEKLMSVPFASLANGVQRLPSVQRGDGLNLTRCVQWAVAHPEEKLLFPKDLKYLTYRLGRLPVRPENYDQAIIARWRAGIPSPPSRIINRQPRIPIPSFSIPANYAVQPIAKRNQQASGHYNDSSATQSFTTSPYLQPFGTAPTRDPTLYFMASLGHHTAPNIDIPDPYTGPNINGFGHCAMPNTSGFGHYNSVSDAYMFERPAAPPPRYTLSTTNGFGAPAVRPHNYPPAADTFDPSIPVWQRNYPTPNTNGVDQLMAPLYTSSPAASPLGPSLTHLASGDVPTTNMFVFSTTSQPLSNPLAFNPFSPAATGGLAAFIPEDSSTDLLGTATAQELASAPAGDFHHSESSINAMLGITSSPPLNYTLGSQSTGPMPQESSDRTTPGLSPKNIGSWSPPGDLTDYPLPEFDMSQFDSTHEFLLADLEHAGIY
jgi:hypothetical protein